MNSEQRQHDNQSIPPEDLVPSIDQATDIIVPGYTNRFASFFNKGSILPIIAVLMLTIGIVSSSKTNESQDIRSKATLDGPVLSMNPSSKTLIPGETTSIGILLNTNTDAVSVAELHLSYDPTAIQIMNFTPNPTLPVILKAATFDSGKIDVALGSQPTAPFKGSGILGVMTVKLLAIKTSSIAFTDATIVASIGKTTNALLSKTGSTITGNGPTATQLTSTPTRIPTTVITPDPKIFPTFITTPISRALPTPTSTPTPTRVVVNTPTNSPTPTPNPYNGKPVKGSSATTYLMENGARRPIPNWDTFLSLGFIQADQITLPDALIDSFPMGSPIPSVVK